MGGYFFISTMVYNTMIRIKAMYSIVSTPSKMRRQGFVDGIACAAAFFHRGLCPLCGGGFRRCRSESLLFTPAEEGGRCPPACRLRHGLGKSYRKAFTESHISTQKSGRISCRFSLSIRTTPRAQIPGIISHCARELRPDSAWPWRAAILWRPTKTKEVYLGFSAPA